MADDIAGGTRRQFHIGARGKDLRSARAALARASIAARRAGAASSCRFDARADARAPRSLDQPRCADARPQTGTAGQPMREPAAGCRTARADVTGCETCSELLTIARCPQHSARSGQGTEPRARLVPLVGTRRRGGIDLQADHTDLIICIIAGRLVSRFDEPWPQAPAAMAKLRAVVRVTVTAQQDRRHVGTDRYVAPNAAAMARHGRSVDRRSG